MIDYFPKYFTSKAIYVYIAAVIVVTAIFFVYSMNWYWYVIGAVSVVGFFYFSNTLTIQWQRLTEKSFRKKLFLVALVIRLVWVIFSYFFYIEMTGVPFEFEAADSHAYDGGGVWVGELIRAGNIKVYFDYVGTTYSDAGYMFYVGIIYAIFGRSIIIVRLLKTVISAYTCILIYQLSSRTFGVSTGRIAAILCMLMPNLIYYCGLHLKETEMIFLVVAFVERADYAMRSGKFTISNLVLPVVLGASLFTFRTVLGATAFFSFFTALIFSPGRVIKGWKRLILVAWVAMAVAYFMGGKIATEVEEMWGNRADNQSTAMEWHATREGGNQYAKYATGVMFAPFIFSIPFPTVVDIPVQQNQQLLHGGNYVKGIMAFFVLFALFVVIKNKTWRNYILIGAFTLAYLVVIASSSFVHSERFHQPALPFELIMAAYGISMVKNKVKNYYIVYLIFIFAAIVGWSWFKLAGRGLV